MNMMLIKLYRIALILIIKRDGEKSFGIATQRINHQRIKTTEEIRRSDSSETQGVFA